MGNICRIVFGILTILLLALHASGQVYDLRELNNREISQLPRERTVVLMPGGILEQHGPYLPSYTDGYSNEYIARQVANAIVARAGWVVLMFPPIPLGVGGVHLRPNPTWPGTIHVHFETLRSVYMDLASELGEAGFRWVFVFQDHGSRQHKLALDQASDFFTDTYHGRMVHLGGLVISSSASDRLTLSPEIDKENGLDIHAGLDETSRMLFLRPDLVDPQRVSAVPLSGQTWEELVQIGNRSRWPGYFGSPRLATASIGADILQQEVKEYSGLVLRILDGYDPRKLARQVERKDSDPSSAKYNAATAEHESRIKSIQEEWLTSKGFR